MSRWGTSAAAASTTLTASWTTQQDERIARLEKELAATRLQNQKLTDRLAQLEHIKQGSVQCAEMLWNLSKYVLTTHDQQGNEIVRLPEVAEALAAMPRGSLTMDAKLRLGKYVARMPEFRTFEPREKAHVIADDGKSTISINAYEPAELGELLPAIFRWIQDQPFTVWEDSRARLLALLDTHLIPDMANLVAGYLYIV